MSSRRLPWSAALRDIKSDRSERPAVRFERSRYSRDPAVGYWTGRSGCRYVFRALPAADVDASDLRDMVVLGVDADGGIVGAHSTCTMVTVAEMREVGAVAIHIHTLCETLCERIAVAADLRPLASGDALIAAAHARGRAIAADLYEAR